MTRRNARYRGSNASNTIIGRNTTNINNDNNEIENENNNNENENENDTATGTSLTRRYNLLNREIGVYHPNSVNYDPSNEELNTSIRTNTVTRRLFPARENSTINDNESEINNLIDTSRNTTFARRRRRHRPYTLMSATYYASPLPRTTTITNFDSPHRIRPTIRQINDSTEILNYIDISNNNQPHCPIDLNPFENDDSILRIIPCQHIFREMNLRNHFRYSPRCPICRYDIRDYDIRDYENNQNRIVPSVSI